MIGNKGVKLADPKLNSTVLIKYVDCNVIYAKICKVMIDPSDESKLVFDVKGEETLVSQDRVISWSLIWED